MATLVVPARDLRRRARRRRGDRDRDGAVPARRDHVQLLRPAAPRLAAGRGETNERSGSTAPTPTRRGMGYLETLPRRGRHGLPAAAASSCSCCCSRSTGWRSRRSSRTPSCCRATAIRSGSSRPTLDALPQAAVRDAYPAVDVEHGARLGGVDRSSRSSASVLAAYAIERLRFQRLASRSAWRSSSPTWCRRRSCSFRSPTIVFQLGLFDTRWALILTYPDVPDPVLHLAADGLLPLDPVRARGMRADRRRHAAGRS